MSARELGTEEARKRFAELIERAERGGVSLITRRGKVAAAIVPAGRAAATRGVNLTGLRGTGKGLWGRSVRRYLGRLRDEWR